MNASTVSLAQLTVGQSGTVRSMPTKGTPFLRLREMGVLPGTVLRLARTAPLGDPLEIEVRSYRLTVRRAEAQQVQVELRS